MIYFALKRNGEYIDHGGFDTTKHLNEALLLGKASAIKGAKLLHAEIIPVRVEEITDPDTLATINK